MILAIIDHVEHQLFIEIADDNEIETKYKGDIENYIRDKYGFEDMFSWERLKERIEIIGDIHVLDQMVAHNSKIVELR